MHKVLEVLAVIKKGEQDGLKQVEDDHVGLINVGDPIDFDVLTEKVFGHYTAQVSHHNWNEKDLKECQKLVNMAVSLNDGMFSPLRREIVAPEMHFDFKIEQDWAKYSYDMPDGVRLDGHLAMKGTVDLITKVDDGLYEIVDWKTGKRLNWATGEEKTYDKLQEDPQLRMYHYAASKMFPEIDQIIITIFYIADGGPFSICYTKDDLPKTEEMLRKKFDTIKKVQVPKLTRSWKCTKLCPFGKSTFEGTHIKPIQEFRRGQVTKVGDYMTQCEQIKFEIQRKGMERVTKEYSAPGHDIGFYKAPGTIE